MNTSAIDNDLWKYSIKAPKKDGFLYSRNDTYQGEFLYDLENDPYEKQNLINIPEYNEIKKELSARIVQKLKEAGEPTPIIIP